MPYIELDLKSQVPLQHQLYDALKRIIVQGRVRRGVRLPASRSLARALGVSRNTVLFAYEELAADGMLSGRIGSGTAVVSRVVTGTMKDPDGHPLELKGLD